MFPVGFVNTIAGITEKEAATYNVSTSDQIIAADQYLAGAQTIRGVTTANLSAGNIKAGVTVKVGDAADDDRIAGVAGTFTSDGTAAAGDILNGKISYVNGNKVTGNIPSKAAATYDVSSSDQTISEGQYLSGAQTIRKVTTANLSAANIKAGVTVKVGDAADDDRIAGVAGTFTSDGTAAAGDIKSGKIAYVNGNKVTGTFSWSRQSDYVYNVTIDPIVINVTGEVYKTFDLGGFGRFIFPYKAVIVGESKELPVVCSNHDSSHYYAIFHDDTNASYTLSVSTIAVHCVRITGLM